MADLFRGLHARVADSILRVATVADLPVSATEGDVRWIDDTGRIYGYHNGAWVVEGGGSTTAITSLTGDVTATGPGAAAATVVTVGGALAADIATATAASSNKVTGPASATDNAVTRFDGTTGKLIQDSVVTIADTSGNMAGVGTLSAASLAIGGTAGAGFIDLRLQSSAPTTPAANHVVLFSRTANTVGLLGTGGFRADLSVATITGNRIFTFPDINGVLVTEAGSAVISGKDFNIGNTYTSTAAGFTLQDDGDQTKQMRFSLAGISAGQTRILTVPDASTTLVGTDTAQTFTNKTLTLPKLNENVAVTATATQVNYLSAATGTTGTASTNLVYSTSPTLVTPVLGAATATTVNKVTITQPATGSTLTIVDGGSLITAGAFAITLTATAGTGVTLPTTGTLATLAGTETFTNKTLTSPKLNENVAVTTTATKLNYLTSATGTTGTASGNIVFDVSPTLTTPTIGAATATTINKVTITAPASSAVLTIADGKTLSLTTGNLTLVANASNSSITFPTTGTVATLAGTEVLTNKTLSGNTAATLISGSGQLTLNTTGTVTVPNTTDTLVGKSTTDVLSNKTLSGNTAVTLISGSGTLTLNTTGNVTLPNTTDTLVGLATTDTLTNKTLTSPKLNENVALTTTATKLNFLTSATGTTGTSSTNVVFSTSPALVTPILGAATATSLAFSPSTGGIIGTTTNDNGGAGKVGEYIESTGSPSFANFTTNTYADVATITLTAGDWDVSGQVFMDRNGATVTSIQAGVGISGTSGNSSTGLVNGVTYLQYAPAGTLFTYISLNTPITRVQSDGTNLYINGATISSVQVVRLKGYFDAFSAGAVRYVGQIRARRVR